MNEFGTKIAGKDYIHRPCAYAVLINHQGLIGVVENPKGYFLVGGGIDEGEDPKTALAREALEETGMSIKILEKLGEATDHDSQVTETDLYYTKAGQYYRAEIVEKVTDPIELDHEFKWVSPQEAIDKLFHQGHKWAVEQCL